MLTNQPESRTQPAAPTNPAADVNKDNETAAALKAVIERMERIEQQLAANKDDTLATPQHVLDRISTLGASQPEHARFGDDPTDGSDQISGMSSESANTRRSLPHSNDGIPAAVMNRAKRARRNTAGGAEGTVHSDPLPPPAANGTMPPRIPLQQPTAPRRESNGLSSLSDLSVPSLVDDDAGARWAWEFLTFLKGMDCSYDLDMLRLKGYVEGQLSFEFPLCLSSDTGGHLQYYLKVGGKLSTLIAADPKDRPEQPQQDDELVQKLNILELLTDEKRLKTAEAMKPGYNPVAPSGYLAPLGEVYVAYRSANKPQEVASTNYFVLMEVTSPKKSLWMVYRYERPVQRKDGSQFTGVAVLSHRDSLFRGSRRHFDTVCLVDDVREWRSHTEDMIDMGRFAEALPGGSNVLQPVCYTPVLAAVREAMKQGWEGVVREE
jgi:hypothetical protein